MTRRAGGMQIESAAPRDVVTGRRATWPPGAGT
jgi:hypothetical protein